MAVVQVCTQWDAQTQTCAAAQWQEIQTGGVFGAALPTVEQAEQLGWTFFTSILLLAAFAKILVPSKTEE